MKKKILFGLIVCILMVSSVLAVEVNYTTSDEEPSLHIIGLKYEPYPVNPGEYFYLYISAKAGSGKIEKDVTFELDPPFPFSFDTNEEPVRYFDEIKFSGSVVLEYKVRVDNNAVEGVNDLILRYKTAATASGGSDAWKTKTFKIQVNDAQTNFDLVVQESTDSEVSIAIANIGKNTANSLIVRIPEQDGFRAAGTNGQMIGNLDAGDYSIVSFAISPKNRAEENNLKVQMDYTDNIGERRTVTKEVKFTSSTSSFLPGGLEAGNSGSFPSGARGNFQAAQRSNTSSVWIWIVAVLVIGAGIYIYFKKFNGKKKNKISSDKPGWASDDKK